jgi:tRNA modification GTPase
MRVSGPRSGIVLQALIGTLPSPRVARFCRFCDPASGNLLDEGLALWFPGPGTATGEDLAELHLHGGRAVVAAVLTCLGRQEGLRPATAGEFTRRAFENGRIDLAQAEGLADLLSAETEGQRQSALVLAEGALGAKVAAWQRDLLRVSAGLEADLDFSDEDDVPGAALGVVQVAVKALVDEMTALMTSPPAERLRDGVRVVLAGPPNSGKSSLFNNLAGRHAAIVTDIAGTTRDRIEAPIVLGGLPLILIDTAGLRDDAADQVEAIGIARTGEAMAEADIILWLGDENQTPDGAVLIAAKSDTVPTGPGLAVSVKTGAGLAGLRSLILIQAEALLPSPGSLALSERHRAILRAVLADLDQASVATDALIVAEHLRTARQSLDALTGRSGVEDMLDALFGTFCIGK